MVITHGPGTWLALALIGGAVEAVALTHDHPEDTLSHATRTLCPTTLGKLAFVTGYVAFSGWFLPHIVKGVVNAT